MITIKRWRAVLTAVLWALATLPASASFHTFEIEQVYSNADRTVQFIVLHEAQGAGGQHLLAGHQTLSRHDGTTTTFQFATNLNSSATANKRVLLATPGFAALGLVAPDYILPAGFLGTGAGSIDYAGVDQLTYTSLPTDGTSALDRTGQTVPNRATNYAGASGSVTAAAPPSANYEGLWWRSPAGSESGWGINLAHQGDTIFATWFTYDATGRAWWLSMTAAKTSDGVYAGTLYETRGPPFNAVPFNPAAVTATPVGTGTLSFADASNGSFAYVVNGTAQTKAITRQVFATVPSCAFPAPRALATATNYQDLWWRAPAGSESGWGVNFTHQGDTIFATWFTYNADGSPLWLSATAAKTADRVYAGTLYQTTGPAFSATPFDPARVTANAVGSVMLTFADGNTGTFGYSVNGIAQTKPVTRQVFSNPGTLCE